MPRRVEPTVTDANVLLSCMPVGDVADGHHDLRRALEQACSASPTARATLLRRRADPPDRARG
jgi:hypothetical protein